MVYMGSWPADLIYRGASQGSEGWKEDGSDTCLASMQLGSLARIQMRSSFRSCLHCQTPTIHVLAAESGLPPSNSPSRPTSAISGNPQLGLYV